MPSKAGTRSDRTVCYRNSWSRKSVPIAEKALAWYGIVSVASRLDSTEIGFARAGVALKHALCLWLEVRSDLPTSRRNPA